MSDACPTCGAGIDLGQTTCLYCRRPVLRSADRSAADSAGPLRLALTYCPSCARLYETNDPRCPRCAPARRDLKGGRCPACARELVSLERNGVSIDRCSGCGGMWFDKNEIQRVVNLTVDATRSAALPPMALPPVTLADEVHEGMACVRCTERMVRREVAPGSGAVADFCRRHGLWIRREELERFEEFLEGGGLEKAEIPRGRPPRRRFVGRSRHNLSEQSQIPGQLLLFFLAGFR